MRGWRAGISWWVMGKRMVSFIGAISSAVWLGMQIQATWHLQLTEGPGIIVADTLALIVYTAWHFGFRLVKR